VSTPDVELTPEQPDEVAVAIATALAEPVDAPGPWWRAGLDESLERGGYGVTAGRPRSTLGAARA
jgi:hypothetical protein